jgi:hypothetical protein
VFGRDLDLLIRELEDDAAVDDESGHGRPRYRTMENGLFTVFGPVESPDREWLKTPEGREWLMSDEGGAWLRTEEG